MAKKMLRREEETATAAALARAIAGDQLLQVVDQERILYWLDRYAESPAGAAPHR